MRIRSLATRLAVFCLLAGLASACDLVHARTYRMASGSMEPTIAADSLVLTLRLSDEQRAAVERGQIVVIEAPQRKDTVYLKRVVALGGDVVAMRDGRLWINGDPVGEVYGLHPMLREGGAESSDSTPPGEEFGPVSVPPDHVFVLGDNWDRSLDSRMFGAVPVETVLARRIEW